MAHWLPRHQDDYFIALNNAYAGTYQRRFTSRADASENPETVKAQALAGLKDFGRRAETAIASYKEHKSMGRA